MKTRKLSQEKEASNEANRSHLVKACIISKLRVK